MRRDWMIGFAAVLATALILAGPGEGAAQTKKTLIRLSYTSGLDGATAIVALEQGFFDAEGLLVNATPESSGLVGLQALVGGSTDFSIGANVRPVQALARKLPIKVIALNSYGFIGQVIVPKADQTSKGLADLKGKRIGVQVGSGTHTVFVRALEREGLSEKDFKIVNMETETIPSAFESGAIDAAVPWQPFAAILISKGLGRTLLDERALAEPLKATYPFYVMTNERLLAEKPDVARRFARAWVKTMQWMTGHMDETAEIVQQALARNGIKLPLEVVKTALANTRYDRTAVSEADISDTLANAKPMVEKGRLKKVPGLRAAIDNSFVLAAGGK